MSVEVHTQRTFQLALSTRKCHYLYSCTVCWFSESYIPRMAEEAVSDPGTLQDPVTPLPTPATEQKKKKSRYRYMITVISMDTLNE